MHGAHAAAIAAIVGGPALYLLGCALFKWATNTRKFPPVAHERVSATDRVVVRGGAAAFVGVGVGGCDDGGVRHRGRAGDDSIAAGEG